MRRATAASLLTTVLLSAFALADSPRDRWLNAFDAAQAEAKKTGKPIFLVFR